MGRPLLSRLSSRPAERRPAALATVSLALTSLLACTAGRPGLETAAPPAGAPPESLPALLSGELPYRLELEGVVGSYGSGPGQMAFPQGVALDGLGRLFVADTGNNRVLRFDPAGVYLGEFGGFGFEEGRFDKPRDLLVAGTLNLWVLDGENVRVVKYDLEGRLVGTVIDLDGDEARLRLGRVQPGGMGGEPGGFLYVTDTASDRLLTFDPLSGDVRAVGGFGAHPGRFDFPTGVDVNPRGTVAVADGGNARVQALDSFGGFLRAWPLSGPATVGRVAVAWMPEGRLAVAERDSSRLSVMAGDGRLLARLNARGSDPAELSGPSALASDRLGRLYVADTDNHRVQVFRLVDRRAPPKR